MRRIIEGSPGQDVMFYNAMRAASETGAGLEEVFGSQDDFFKHALVRRAWHCDRVLAVGDLVMRELAFLGGEFRSDPPVLVYNGVEAGEISPGDRKSAPGGSRRVRGAAPRFPPRLRLHPRFETWCRARGCGGTWLVCRALDDLLVRRGRSAVLVVLATAAGRRDPEAVRRMAAGYGWPLVHREGFPDLAGGEEDFDRQVRRFNARSRAVKVVFRQPVRYRSGGLGRGPPRDRFRRPSARKRRRVRAVDLRAVRDSPDRAGRLREHKRRQRCLRLPGIPAGQRRGWRGRKGVHPRRLHPPGPANPPSPGALEIGAEARSRVEAVRGRPGRPAASPTCCMGRRTGWRKTCAGGTKPPRG